MMLFINMFFFNRHDRLVEVEEDRVSQHFNFRGTSVDFRWLYFGIN